MARAFVHPRAEGWARARSDRLNRSCADARTETNRYGDERRVETRRGRTGRRPSLPVVSWTDGRDERRATSDATSDAFDARRSRRGMNYKG